MKQIAAILVVLFALACTVTGQSGKKAIVAGPSLDGQEVTVDLPPQEQFKNIGSKIDGAGMCVFSSVEMSALSMGLEQMRGYRNWWASVSRGGGWPDQVDKSLAKWFAYKKIEPIPYYQYEGKDPGPIFAAIDKTGRMACTTYGYGERYGQGIAHMVNCSGYRKRAIVLDNNFVAKKTATGYDENIYEWMEPAELCRRAKLTGGSAWIFVWLTPPAPPPARSAAPKV